MTIRRTLLTSYLMISLVSALMITAMIVAHLRSVLRTEIEHKLTTQAATIMQQIDTTLFERMKNIATWSRLAVMQEVRVRDIDKRLSKFLHELYDGYGGVYQRLFVVNDAREIIASSRPGQIGESLASAAIWLEATVGRDPVSLQPVDIERQELLLSVSLTDDFQQGRLGRLFAGFDWNEISRLLESPIAVNGLVGVSHALLVDSTGQVIAVSAYLRSRSGIPYPIVQSWMVAEQATGALTSHAAFLDGAEVLIGYARSQGHRTFPGFGWRVLMLQPTRQAFAPVSRLWWTFSLFLFLTVLLGVLVSFWISARIARPIIGLTEFTRDFIEGHKRLPPVLSVNNEIGELRAAFAQMIENLEQSRQDLVRVAKLAVIGEMAASMAHEVRTPLGILRSSAQMLQREEKLSDVGREMTEFVISETDRLNDLVTTLLESARPRPPEFSRYDLHRVIDHTVDMLSTKAADKSIILTTQLDAAQSILFCDRDQLIQVFLNLIMNAIQHTPEGGRIVVATASHGESIEAAVCDNGPGIPRAERKKVFEPFVTHREGGIGLGLTVVQQIVSAHRGRIIVADNPAGGTCFRIELPLQGRR